MHVYLKILYGLIKVHILFNRTLRATLSFWRLRVEAEIRKKKISQIYRHFLTGTLNVNNKVASVVSYSSNTESSSYGDFRNTDEV